MINSFTGLYDFLSNFYMKSILWDSILYPSAEHAYQATKTTDIGMRYWFSSDPGAYHSDDGVRLPVLTAGQAKRKGRELPLRFNWEEFKVPSMLTILMIKFSDPLMGKLLLLTKEEELIEGNTWHDNFWGECNCIKCADKKKHNNLGILLMEVRKQKQIEQRLRKGV